MKKGNFKYEYSPTLETMVVSTFKVKLKMADIGFIFGTN